MSRLPLAVCALGCAFSASAQVSVREPATTARLVNNKTTISLAVTNTASQPLNVIVLLELLGPDDRRHDFARVATVIAPGDSSLDIPLPLSDQFDPLLERLRYELRPGANNYTAFRPVIGILSLTQLADYAFTLSVLSAELPRPGKLYDIPVLTSHPLSGLPVGGVILTSEKSTAISDKNGFATLRVQPPDEDDSGFQRFEIDAHLGDFYQSGETTPLPLAHEDVRIYTDKPLYQPGQTMHVRIIALSGAGAVRAEAEHEIRIEDEDEEVVHSETVTTSRFGIASTDWEIPVNAKAGEYRIEVDRDNLESSFRRTIPIRRYELPSFRVRARPEHPF
jgi:MG2 domain